MGVESKRILVAEDDTAFLAVLGTVLGADARFSVVGYAHNGREAIELARALKPDAVVMDIEMPEVDGVEATRAIAPAIPVLAISGHDYEERVLEIRQAGAGDYVRKARVAEELCDALAALLRRD
ncbi:MAG: response regulator transcription factor [Actinomycetota bacterium]